MTVDHDGKIRMDCSSPYAMARLVGLKDRFRVAFANDPDADRHGIVTRSAGLMNPNHYLAVAIRYLLTHRPRWPAHAAVGKTLVSSSMIDRVVAEPRPPAVRGAGGLQVVRPGAARRHRPASAARRAPGRASCGRTAPSGPPTRTVSIMDLLAAEITARTGKDPGEHYRELTAEFGAPYYTRIDAPATPGAEGPAREAVARGGQGADARRRADHRQADPRPGQRRPDRRPEGRGADAAGSRPGPRAPRTSTRSTRRASSTRRTWTPSWPRLAPSWTVPWDSPP